MVRLNSEGVTVNILVEMFTPKMMAKASLSSWEYFLSAGARVRSESSSMQ